MNDTDTFLSLSHSVALDTWNFAQSFSNVYKCSSWCQNSSTLHSGIKNALLVFLGGCSGNIKMSLVCQFTQRQEILHTVTSIFVYVSPYIIIIFVVTLCHSLTLESCKPHSQLSFLGVLSMLWRYIGDWYLPVYLEIRDKQ